MSSKLSRGRTDFKMTGQVSQTSDHHLAQVVDSPAQLVQRDVFAPRFRVRHVNPYPLVLNGSNSRDGV